MRVFKNLNLGGLAALVLAGFFAISWSEAKIKLAPTSGWYFITAPTGDINNPSDQIIGLRQGENPPSGSCSEDHVMDPCQVLLDLSQFTGTSITGLSVADATNPLTYKGKIDVNNSNNDGYARQED